MIMKEFNKPLSSILPDTPSNLGFQDMVIGGWNIKVLSKEESFTGRNIEQSLEAINRWAQIFPKEETYVQRQFSIPSLIIRLDCSVQDGNLGIYEIEERPSGIGLTRILNPDFQQRLDLIRTTWPVIKSVVSDDPRRKATDDHLWIDKLEPENTEDLVLVRAEPEETDYHFLEPRSVSSLKKKGDKSYGEGLGLWRRVTKPDEIDFESGCVIKPLQGSKTRDVFIYVPGPGSKRPPGASSRGRIEQAVNDAAESGGVFCQSYFPPMESGISDEFKWMIYRVFFGYNTNTANWECLGGSWNARYNLKIHGAGDSLSGPVVVKT